MKKRQWMDVTTWTDAQLKSRKPYASGIELNAITREMQRRVRCKAYTEIIMADFVRQLERMHVARYTIHP